MRVIAGCARGRKLKMVPGDSTRPVMDRVKEALFNILGVAIQDSSFLDLFAGTGSVGIEALSRGAARVRFVDNNRLAVRTIRENLESTHLMDRAEILRADVFSYLRRPQPEPFEFVYIAPPQYKSWWKETLAMLDTNPGHLQPDAVVVAQIDPAEYEDLALQRLLLYDQRTYGKTRLCFYEYQIEDIPDGALQAVPGEPSS